MTPTKSKKFIVNFTPDSEESPDTVQTMEDKNTNKVNLRKKVRNDGECEGEEDTAVVDTGEEIESEPTTPSRCRRESYTSETESDDSNKEDFSTEGLLKELHFLNAR